MIKIKQILIYSIIAVFAVTVFEFNTFDANAAITVNSSTTVTAPATSAVSPAITPPTRGMECLVSQPTLKRGSTGECAIFWQIILNKLGLSNNFIGIDGQFGKQTEAGIKAYQAANKDSDGNALVVDGIVGPKTWSSIKQKLQPAASAPIAEIKPDDGPGGINRFASKIDPACVREFKQGDAGECVKKIQTLLGFTGADVDGNYGSLTKQQVANFQKGNTDIYGNWLAASGVVTYATLAKLLSGQFNPVAQDAKASLSMSSDSRMQRLLNSPTAKRYRAMQKANSARNRARAAAAAKAKRVRSKSKKSKSCRRNCGKKSRGGRGNNKGSSRNVSTGYRGGDMGSSFHGGGTYSSYQSYYAHNRATNSNRQITGGF